MRNSPLFLLVVFVLALATAYAFSQEHPHPAPAALSSSDGANDPLAIVPAEQVQSEIENAVHREPGLSADRIDVKVSDDTIEISGTVNSGKEKVAAYRLAESFAMNRRVKDLVTVANRSTSQASNTAATPKQMRATDKSSSNATASLRQTNTTAQAAR